MRATAVNPWLRSLGSRCEFCPRRRQTQVSEQRLFVREMMRNLWWWCVVNQCGLEQLNKASLPGRSIVTRADSFFFSLVKQHFHSGKSEQKIYSLLIKYKSVCIYASQQSALCGINRNPCWFEDILLSPFKDYIDDNEERLILKCLCH